MSSHYPRPLEAALTLRLAYEQRRGRGANSYLTCAQQLPAAMGNLWVAFNIYIFVLSFL